MNSTIQSLPSVSSAFFSATATIPHILDLENIFFEEKVKLSEDQI